MPTQRRFEIVNTYACDRLSRPGSDESSSRMARDDVIVFWLCAVLLAIVLGLLAFGVIV